MCKQPWGSQSGSKSCVSACMSGRKSKGSAGRAGSLFSKLAVILLTVSLPSFLNLAGSLPP